MRYERSSDLNEILVVIPDLLKSMEALIFASKDVELWHGS